MKKFIKSLGIIALAAVIVFSMASCDPDDGNGGVVDTKTDPDVTWPTGLTATVGQTLSQVTIPAHTGATPGTFAWTNPTDDVGEAGTRWHNMTFTPTDTAKYNTLTDSVAITVSPVKTDPVVTWPTDLTATVGQTLADVLLPGNGWGEVDGEFSWTASLTTPVGAEGARTHIMTFTPTDTAAYNTITNSVTITVFDPNNITSAEKLAAYLEAATGGATADDPIVVRVNVSDLGGNVYNSGSIGDIILLYHSKSVSLDLSGSTFTSIGDYAFTNCYNLVSVTIGNSVTSIGDYAFDSTSLASVTIPDSVESIGQGAFRFCASLESVTIGKGVENIGDYAFIGYYYDNISLAEINVDITNAVYSSEEGVLYNKTKTILYQYPARKPETTFSIPGSVESIGDGAFRFCANLTSVTIPNNVTSIGFSAFAVCTSLTEIIIPDNVENIGEGAFELCTSLERVTFERNNYAYRLYSNAFPGDLVTVSGGEGHYIRFGIYTTSNPGDNPSWTKQE